MESLVYIGGRILEERKRLRLTQQDVADFVGITRQSQAKYEKGERSPDAIYLEKILGLGFNSYYVLTGNKSFPTRSHLDDDDNSSSTHKDSNESVTYEKRDRKSKVGQVDPTSNEEVGSSIKDYSAGTGSTMEAFVHIPLFDVKASAGNGYVIHEEEETDALIFKKEWIYNELHSSPANLYLIYVEGESMEPALRPGDVILVDHTDNVAKRDGIYVIRMGESLLVKRLQRLPSQRLKVTSDNPAYEPFEISLDFDLHNELSIIGRVVWSGRRH